MNRTLEVTLHWWASLTIVIVGLVAAVAGTSVRFPSGEILFSVIPGVAGCVVAGFYFYMLVECAIGMRIKRRAAWVIFLVVFPVFSAIIYFMISRSTLYSSAEIAPRI